MTWWQYLILANVYLILFYAFYVLLLRRETFFQLNRFYLVGSAILSFIVPVMQTDWTRNLFITQKINQTIYHLDPVVIYRFQPQEATRFTIGQGLAIIYLAGILFLALRFTLQLVLLQRSLRNPVTEDAYSFFKNIKLSDKIADRAIILAHEQVHAKQWHSADVLLIEAIMIINWFNPAVYFYRKAIKHIHEFIADRNAIQSGTSKQEYALLLLSETFKTPAHQLVNPFFNHSLLKQRIVMLQKSNSQRTALFKYGLSAPLFALMLILSSATVKTNEVISIINKKAEQVMMLQASPNTVADAYGANIVKSITVLPSKPAIKDFVPAAKLAPETSVIDTGTLFTVVEQSASFPGGITAFGQYLGRNIRYPAEARKNNVQGRVIIQFIVEKNGSLSNIHVLRGVGSGCDEEALRVISESPKWKPGTQNGKKVRQQYTVPISFNLQSTDDLPKNQPTPDSASQKTIIHRQQLTEDNTPRVISYVGGTITDKKPHTISFSTRVDSNAKPLTIAVANNSKPPLYYIDGVLADYNALKTVKPNNIKSINVYKTGIPAAFSQSASGGGVILITTIKHDQTPAASN